MPLYEYECISCGNRSEIIQKFSDAPLETCEKCGGKLEQLLSSPAIQFKGSGWYITDYARKSSATEEKKPEAPAESAAKGDGDKSGASSTASAEKSKSNKSTSDSPSAKT